MPTPVPKPITEFSDEELSTLEVDLATRYNEKRQLELTSESVQELGALRTELTEVRDEIARRAELKAQIEEIDSEVAASEDKVKGTTLAAEETPEAEATEAEAEEPAPEEVTASLSPNGLDAPEGSEPTPKTAQPYVITAGADIPATPAGAELPNMTAVAEAFIARRGNFRGVDRAGDGDRVIVASVKADFPEERWLKKGEASGNQEKVDALVAALEQGADPQALVASGGICAPAEPYYGLQNLSGADRPVRDMFPVFGADRGAITFITPPRLTDLANAIGIRTAAQDASGYPPTALKAPLRVTCGVQQTVTIQAIYRHLIFGNFGARTFPEQVETWLALSLAQHARVAETALLDRLAASSTAITAAATYGASRTLLPQIDQALASFKSRHRITESRQFRWAGPSWTKELMRADIARQQFPGFPEAGYITDEMITSWFRSRGVTPTFYLDTPTGAGMQFGAQSAGAMLGFPTTVVWYLYPEGSFLFLDGGTLDLGLVRDSTLNQTNDYSVFAETFENLAFVGIESYQVTSTVCPSGAGPTGATVITC